MELTDLLPGWHLYFDTWKIDPSCTPGDDVVHEIVSAVTSRFSSGPISNDSTVKAVRALFREAGTDPTRYRPSFEALARRVLKGEPLPRINPAVDICNLLSLLWHVPCCVADLAKITPPVSMRAGRPDETMESLRGPINLEGKPLIEDRDGPYSTPITDSKRASVDDITERVSFVAYFPADFFDEKRICEDIERFNLQRSTDSQISRSK